MEQDGYLNINAACRFGSFRVHLNGTEVAMGNQSNSSYDCDYTFIPVKEGDKLACTGYADNTGSYSCMLWVHFIPFK